MTYLRWLFLLGRASRILRRLPFKDRWGFNLGDDLDEWTLMKRWVYADRVEALAHKGWEPVTITTGPRCDPSRHFHAGTNIHITWPEPGGSCDKCGLVTTATARPNIGR